MGTSPSLHSRSVGPARGVREPPSPLRRHLKTILKILESGLYSYTYLTCAAILHNFIDVNMLTAKVGFNGRIWGYTSRATNILEK
eukprot:scaffold208534_cov30-Tisochrysis_lutea.AAC.1